MNFKQWLEVYQQGVILIASGAYNPIHRGHIQIFYHAKRYLLGKGYNVMGAYLIPRNPSYIQQKSAAKGEVPVGDNHRQTMIQTAIQGTFIKILPLEQEKSNLSREEIRLAVQQMHPNQEIIWVAGNDRGECPNSEETCLIDKPRWGKTIIVARTLAYNASSSQVRQNLMTTGDEPNLLSPGVRSYIKKNRLWNAA
jgi:nicotinic acid mononucleotide adenylyltransferase